MSTIAEKLAADYMHTTMAYPRRAAISREMYAHMQELMTVCRFDHVLFKTNFCILVPARCGRVKQRSMGHGKLQDGAKPIPNAWNICNMIEYMICKQ